MHLWAIRAVFGGVRNLPLKIKWLSPPERYINHLELPYLVDLAAYLEWHLCITVRNICTCWESSGVKDSYSARTSRVSRCNILSQYGICPGVTSVRLLGGTDGRDDTHTLDVPPDVVGKPSEGWRKTMWGRRSTSVLETDRQLWI